MQKYFYKIGNKRFGPYSKEELLGHSLPPTTKVWTAGMAKWTDLSEVSELSDVLDWFPSDGKKISSFNNSNLDKFRSNSNWNTGNRERLLNDKNRSRIILRIVVGLFGVIIISSVIMWVNNRRIENILYKEIVSNAYDSDEDFDIYVQKFYRDLEYYGIYPTRPETRIVKFARLDRLENTTHIHGVSFGAGNDKMIEIYINPSTWEQFDKPMRYYLMYHELAHDVLNLDDLDARDWNKGKLMYPEIAVYDNIGMDDFIESSHALFEEVQDDY